ncbi:DUF421 domain-containing protein [Antrihabitans cavernicola]|uniref:DUF421 domain-containing protein n=1 Tax=Antrihabitans cavernicola TaxID=2495913 RepID=A0A5A7SDJ4_9NOCA|nr:YetF domain-containing protein [Spelaeibacter cavernicola]KAA0023996.1 DUF421 domain-containing protein [Spelaeibacter cavernicola]
MFNDLFQMQIPMLEKILRTVLVYVVIIVLFRMIGKRGLAALNTFDFVVIFLLSNVVQNAIIGEDNSLLGGAIGAVTLIAVNAAVNRLIVVSPLTSRLLEGTATTVITDGKVDEAEVRRLGLDRAELEHAVRVQNGDSIADVTHGELDPSGKLVLDVDDDAKPVTRRDLAEVLARLDSIDRRLSAQR